MQRTLIALRRDGWLADVAERWIPHSDPPQTRDLFGVADIVAAHPTRKAFLLVQATVRSCIPARVAKCRKSVLLAKWLEAGGLFEIWGWDKIRGEWVAKIVTLSGAEMTPEVVQTPKRRRP